MYRILLADDEGIMLESLKKIIETEYGNECEIHCAKSGRVVVEMAQAYPPDICFMDIQMPGISGIQAIREIQKFNSSAVFVIITAYDKFNYAKEAVNLGVQEFLTKPVNKKVILETCELSKVEIVTACNLVQEAGAQFVKTSTGFAAKGADPADIQLMRETVGPDMGVKASGGIRTLDQALAMLEAGANRIGVSAGEALLAEWDARFGK